jgi:hypothetical protein
MTGVIGLSDVGYQRLVGVASLSIAPLVMAVGDLLHPRESADVAEQAAIVLAHASRWYAAHLLLFIGLILFIPGVLELTKMAATRRPRVGYAARLLLLVGLAGFSAVFLSEMLAGRLGADGSAATEELLDAMFSGPIAALLVPLALAFFAGVGLLAVPLVRDGGEMRWPATALLVGFLFILAEIVSSQVLLSQIGNVVVWIGSFGFAARLVRDGNDSSTAPG